MHAGEMSIKLFQISPASKFDAILLYNLARIVLSFSVETYTYICANVTADRVSVGQDCGLASYWPGVDIT